MTEPFPNALNAIQNAFDMKDLTSKFLELICAHSDLSTITVIVITCINLVQQSPFLVDKLMDTLVILKNTKITIGRLSDPTEIAHALNWELVSWQRACLCKGCICITLKQTSHHIINLCNNYKVFTL